MSPWAVQLFVDVAGLSFGMFLLSPYILTAAISVALAVKAFREKLKD